MPLRINIKFPMKNVKSEKSEYAKKKNCGIPSSSFERTKQQPSW